MTSKTDTTKRTRTPKAAEVVVLDVDALDRLPIEEPNPSGEYRYGATWPITLSVQPAAGRALYSAIWNYDQHGLTTKKVSTFLKGGRHPVETAHRRGSSLVSSITFAERADVEAFESWLRLVVEPAWAAYAPDWAKSMTPGDYYKSELKALVALRRALNTRLVEAAERYEANVASQHKANVKAAFADAPTYIVEVTSLSNNDREVHVSLQIIPAGVAESDGWRGVERFRSEIDCRFTLDDETHTATPTFGFDKYDICARQEDDDSTSRYVESFDDAVAYSTACLAGLAFKWEAERLVKAEQLRVDLLVKAEADLKAQASS